MLRAHLQALCAERPQPDGWLGISFTYSGEMDVEAARSLAAFTFKKYPTIETVDPGSPARRPASRPGRDRHVGSFDMVSGALNVASLLTPGVQLPRALPPRRVLRASPCSSSDDRRGCLRLSVDRGHRGAALLLAMQPRMRICARNGFGYVFGDSSSTAGRAPMIVATPIEPGAPRLRETTTPVLPPTPYAPFRLQGALPSSNAIVGGAVLVPMSDQLRQGLGLDEGILVFDVLRSSPALEAGLAPDDIITP